MVQTSAWLAALALQAVGSARAAAPAPDDAELETASASAEEPEPEPTTEATPTSQPEPVAEAEPGTESVAGIEPAATAEPATTTSTEPVPASPTSTTAGARPRTYPRLVIAGGPIVGPHALGNEQCDAELARCETKGSFLGLGGQVELRARLWRMIQAHARGLAVGNVSPNERVHRGLVGLGVGLGLQGRRAFGRAEYLLVSTFGDNRFEPPFFEGEVGSDEWGHHAGMVSVGFRQPLPHRLAAELWGGLVIGPRSVRRISDTPPDERVLTTFLVGVNVSWDAWP